MQSKIIKYGVIITLSLSVVLTFFAAYIMISRQISLLNIMHIKTWQNMPTILKDYPTTKNNIAKKDKDINDNNQLRIYYKVNCPACDAALPIIKQQLKENHIDKQHIVYINVETPIGKKLVKQYNITHASTMQFASKITTETKQTAAIEKNKQPNVWTNNSLKLIKLCKQYQ